MFKRCVTIVLVLAMSNFCLTCTRTIPLKPEKLEPTGEKIVKLSRLDGKIVVYDDDGGLWFQAAGTIEGFGAVKDSVNQPSTPLSRYSLVRVPVDSVLQVWVKRSNPVGTVFAVLGITALAVGLTIAIIAAAKDCCPFVYSWTGERFEFDAEPLGGAICQALQRSDCSRLEHLRADNGQYRLMFRNEVPEIQFVDQVQLLVVDHDPNLTIIPDSAEVLHEIKSPVTTTYAVDENGNDISSFVRSSDGVAWQTQMHPSTFQDSTDARHHWRFTFPKPQHARTARVLYNAGTALWGSNMIREMLQLRGSSVDAWYADVNRHGGKLLELFLFNLREEMYFMKLYADSTNTAVERGFLVGGGPFLAEDRVTTIDVSALSGDSLVLSCNPAKTFWTLDYLAVEYDAGAVVTPIVINPRSATDQNGTDLLPALGRVDSDYYVMPEMEDWSEMTFTAPPEPTEGLTRSIFLKTAGYYEVKIDKTRPPQVAEINRLLKTPQSIVYKSIELYRQWYGTRAEMKGN